MHGVVKTNESIEGFAIQDETPGITRVDVPCFGSLIVSEKADAAKVVVFHGHEQV